MALAGMKLSLDDQDRALLGRLTDVLAEAVVELKRYNDGPPVEYAEADPLDNRTTSYPEGR